MLRIPTKREEVAKRTEDRVDTMQNSFDAIGFINEEEDIMENIDLADNEKVDEVINKPPEPRKNHGHAKTVVYRFNDDDPVALLQEQMANHFRVIEKRVKDLERDNSSLREKLSKLTSSSGEEGQSAEERDSQAIVLYDPNPPTDEFAVWHWNSRRQLKDRLEPVVDYLEQLTQSVFAAIRQRLNSL